MGIGSHFHAIERRYAWGFIGFIAGTALSIAGLYFAIHEKRPAPHFEVVSESNVLDIHAALPDLSVLYRGQDIQKSNLNLKILRLRVSNAGQADILQSLYDQHDTFGVQVAGGLLLEARQVDAASEYLRDATRPTLIGPNTVEFQKPILEPGAWFTIELLVLHDKKAEPRLQPLGKIAGVVTPRVSSPTKPEGRPSIWHDITRSSWQAHVLRLFVYPFAAVLLALVVGMSIALGGSWLEAKARKRRAGRIRSLLETASPEEIVAKEIIVTVYARDGANGLMEAFRFTGDPDRLKKASSRRRASGSLAHTQRLRSIPDSDWDPDTGAKHDHDLILLSARDRAIYGELRRDVELVEKLESNRLLSVTDEHYQVSSVFRIMLEKAIRTLEPGKLPPTDSPKPTETLS